MGKVGFARLNKDLLRLWNWNSGYVSLLYLSFILIRMRTLCFQCFKLRTRCCCVFFFMKEESQREKFEGHFDHFDCISRIHLKVTVSLHFLSLPYANFRFDLAFETGSNSAWYPRRSERPWATITTRTIRCLFVL